MNLRPAVLFLTLTALLMGCVRAGANTSRSAKPKGDFETTLRLVAQFSDAMSTRDAQAAAQAVAQLRDKADDVSVVDQCFGIWWHEAQFWPVAESLADHSDLVQTADPKVALLLRKSLPLGILMIETLKSVEGRTGTKARWAFLDKRDRTTRDVLDDLSMAVMVERDPRHVGCLLVELGVRGDGNKDVETAFRWVWPVIRRWPRPIGVESRRNTTTQPGQLRYEVGPLFNDLEAVMFDAMGRIEDASGYSFDWTFFRYPDKAK